MKIYIFDLNEGSWIVHSSQSFLTLLAAQNAWGEVSYLKSGKPIVSHGYVSVTHAQQRLIIAYNTLPIGIDCEYPRNISETLIKRFKLNPLNPLYEWCCKEAWIKLDDNFQHLSDDFNNQVIFTQIPLDDDCLCVCASYETIPNFEIHLKKV